MIITADVKFSNGEVHSCTFFSFSEREDGKHAHIALDDVDYVDAARIFAEAEMINSVEYGGKIYTGLDTLLSLSTTSYGIQASLIGRNR